MAANPSIQLGTDGNWAIKEDNLLAYKKDGDRFFNKEFDFTRNTTATFVDKDGLIKTVTSDIPRIDFTDDATGHLLLEPQRQNLIPYSQFFNSGSGWQLINNVTIGSQVLSPDGGINATEIVFDGTANGRIERAITGLTSGSDYTVSVYARVASGTQEVFFGSFEDAAFTVTTEWQRLTRTQPENDATAYPRLRCNDAATIEIYGFQLEAGSYATSYIPTYGSSATRNLEVCTNSGGSVEDFNGEEGVLFIDVARFKNDLNYLTLRLSQDNSEYNEVAFKFRNTEGFIFARTIKDGVSRGFIEYTFPPGEDDSLNKLAFSYQENSCSLWVNGQNVGNFSGPSNSAQGTLKYLQLARGSGEPFYGKVKNVQVFKRAMSNGELYLLTVTQYQSYQEMATALNYTL